MTIEIGVDVGGTFTDLVVAADGDRRVYKTPSTPDDPARGVITGITLAADDVGEDLRTFLGRVERIVHGTTITTNAVLTGNGARVGFLTTRGFRDLLNMRRGLREHQYSNKYGPPPALVPRHRIIPITERIDVEGTVSIPLVESDVVQAARFLRDENVEAVAVSYLWSFLNPSHERRTIEILREELPGVYLSASSDVLPQIRVYERNSTTALNAYVGPPLSRYLANLRSALDDSGFGGVLLIMQSNGGVMAPEVASRLAVNTLLSGPAGGPVAGVAYGALHGLTNVITVDMGGTSFDVSLVQKGEPVISSEASISGYHVGVPMLDTHTIGSGGGSIASIDSGGLFTVGPASAGADPGPACYSRGGENPTVTDADLLLGYLDPSSFSDAIALNPDLAREAVRSRVAEPLGLDVTAAAAGIYEIVNSDMAGAVRVVSVNRGHDPREFALVIAGGAGAVHACPIAEELGIDFIMVPHEASVLCAAGMLLSDLKHTFVRTYPVDVAELDLDHVRRLLREMTDDATATLRAEKVEEDQIRYAYAVDARYIGQFGEVEVPAFPGLDVSADTVADVVSRFHKIHDNLYGYSMESAPVEIINLRLTAVGETETGELTEIEVDGLASGQAMKGTRPAYFDGDFVDTPVYDAELLAVDEIVEGPAIVEQSTTAIVVTPSFHLSRDRWGNYVLRRRADAGTPDPEEG
ncbi:MAG: hydantoinase/oxoprolinase family protein [Acidimicrobiales bacterium]